MALLKTVLDTNVVVSAHVSPDGFPRRVLQLALTQKFQLYISREIFREYEDVLYREKFGFDPETVAKSLQAIKKAAITVSPKRRLSVSPDPDDNRFLECAEAAKADYLVTGNKRHFPENLGKTTIVNAREFIEIFALGFHR
jgi:putative PIN family toxin of toxin-antitoxin system